MSRGDGDRLTMPAPWWALGGLVILVVVVLGGAGQLDAHRRAAQLDRVRAQDCAATLPPEVMGSLESLSVRNRVNRRRARSLAKRVKESFAASRSVEIFYRRAGVLWSVTPWHGPTIPQPERLLEELGDWEALMSEESCTTQRVDRQFVTVRAVRPGTSAAVLIVTRQRLSS